MCAGVSVKNATADVFAPFLHFRRLQIDSSQGLQYFDFFNKLSHSSLSEQSQGRTASIMNGAKLPGKQLIEDEGEKGIVRGLAAAKIARGRTIYVVGSADSEYIRILPAYRNGTVGEYAGEKRGTKRSLTLGKSRSFPDFRNPWNSHAPRCRILHKWGLRSL